MTKGQFAGNIGKWCLIRKRRPSYLPSSPVHEALVRDISKTCVKLEVKGWTQEWHTWKDMEDYELLEWRDVPE